jgi:MFS family permease
LKTSGRLRLEYGYTIVIVAFVMMMIIWGTFNTFGVFFEPLINQFGWTRTMTSGASALNSMIFGIICIFSAGLSERFGPRWVTTVCGVILGLSYFLMARIGNPWELYLYLGVFAAIGMSPYIPLLSLVPRWFPTNRGRMNAIVMSGMGLGILVMPPVAGYLISLWQWRNAYLAIAILTLLVMVAASQFLKNPPGEAASPSGPADHHDEGRTLGQALRSREFGLLCILYFSFLFSLIAISVHLVIHATGLGIPVMKAAITLSLIGGASIIGMNVMGNLADRFSNRIALGISYTIMALSLFWLIPSGSEWSLFVFSIAFGFAYGGMQVLFSPLVAELFGTRSHGVILATGALAGSVGAALGPIVAGYIFDVLGSYTVAFILCAVLTLTGLVSTLLLPSPSRRVPTLENTGRWF